VDLSVKVLGTTVARTLQARIAAPVLEIGKDRFSRVELARVECFNFVACGLLTRALHDLKVSSTRDLYDNYPPTALALPTVGVISLAVLGAAFEHHGLGGAAPLETWMRKHQQNGGGMVTFATVKARDAEEKQTERRAKTARKHTRRNAAHALRVKRFEART
jgi:hypothetical protein